MIACRWMDFGAIRSVVAFLLMCLSGSLWDRYWCKRVDIGMAGGTRVCVALLVMGECARYASRGALSVPVACNVAVWFIICSVIERELRSIIVVVVVIMVAFIVLESEHVFASSLLTALLC